MINGSVIKPTEVMTERDSINAFIDSSKKASYAARELAKACQDPSWETVAVTLESMCIGAKKLFDMKAMSRFETLMAADLKTRPYQPN